MQKIDNINTNRNAPVSRNQGDQQNDFDAIEIAIQQIENQKKQAQEIEKKRLQEHNNYDPQNQNQQKYQFKPKKQGSAIIAVFEEMKQQINEKQKDVQSRQDSKIQDKQSNKASKDNDKIKPNRQSSQISNIQILQQQGQAVGSIYSNVNNAVVDQERIKKDEKDPALREQYQGKIKMAVGEKQEMDEHLLSVEQLCRKLNTDEQNGLTEEQAEEIRNVFGRNVLPEPKKISGWILYLKEITNFFAILLWTAGWLCILAYFLQPASGISNVILGASLFFVVLVTGFLTYIQNAKSSALMDSFKDFLPPQCYAVRKGKRSQVNAADLVPGDIVEIKQGDKIPADLRIIQSRDIKVDNSPLTGEADLQARKKDNIEKNPLEATNLVFFGTLCKEGSGQGIVIRIGANTVLGQIADVASSGEKAKTPLKLELDRFVYILAILSVVIGLIFLFCAKFLLGYDWITCLVFAIGIVVANVPEGLLGELTVCLKITAEMLSKKKVLVKNLEGVETLGSTSCICSDKTGTLTQNKMTVSNLWYNGNICKAINILKVGMGNKPEYDIKDSTFIDMQDCAVISSEATFDEGELKKRDEVTFDWLTCKVNGDASETAIVRFYQPIEELEKTRSKYLYGRTPDNLTAKMPFNSTEKFALSIVQISKQNSDYCIYFKGAPERLWDRSTQILVNGSNQIKNKQWEESFNQANKTFGRKGERVLGFAKLHLKKSEFPLGFKFETSKYENFNFPANELTFLGLISLIDPPKDSVPMAVKKCRSAGIKVIMVTGDQAPTAESIAKEIFIIPKDLKTNIDLMEENENMSKEEAISQSRAVVIKGDWVQESRNQQTKIQTLNGVPEDKIDKDVELRSWVKKDFVVFARTSPEQKLYIVRACQQVGYIVAVTGDGVNDSPAIKQADIGISMGISGTEVTKDAADMILLDDDFSSIVNGVEEGRRLFDNLKKAIIYILITDFIEIIPFIAQIVCLIPLAMSFFQMLVVCIGTDILPAISLAYEQPEIDIMTRNPRRKTDHLVTMNMIAHGYPIMGVIGCGAGFYSFFTCMYWYGFEIQGMFSNYIGYRPTAPRCAPVNNDGTCTNQTLIPFGNYDPSLPNLGNPYLPTNITNQDEADKLLTGNSQVLDWQNYGDYQYDLRQIFVRYDAKLQRWFTKEGIFRQCENIPNSLNLGFSKMQKQYQESITDYDYVNGNYRTPVCYSVEALKYGQTAYFVAVVTFQWMNIFTVKAKTSSVIYTAPNRMMFYGIIMETFIVIFMAYVPGVQYVLLCRPILIWVWCSGLMFSMFLFAWGEGRKYLMRLPATNGSKNNWFSKQFAW